MGRARYGKREVLIPCSQRSFVSLSGLMQRKVVVPSVIIARNIARNIDEREHQLGFSESRGQIPLPVACAVALP